MHLYIAAKLLLLHKHFILDQALVICLPIELCACLRITNEQPLENATKSLLAQSPFRSVNMPHSKSLATNKLYVCTIVPA